MRRRRGKRTRRRWGGEEGKNRRCMGSHKLRQQALIQVIIQQGNTNKYDMIDDTHYPGSHEGKLLSSQKLLNNLTE